MKIVQDDYGQVFAVLTNGDKLRLHEQRNTNRLEVSAYDGAILIRPTSSNVVEIGQVSHFQMETDARERRAERDN